jgi:hypothetical protein
VGLISIFIATPLADKLGVQWIFLFSGLLALATLPLVGYMTKAFAGEFQPTLKAEAMK